MSMKVSKEDLNIKEPTKLKILEQTIKIQGQYGIYIKSSEGVKTLHFSFKDITEVKDYSKAIESEYKAKKEELYNKINELNKEMHEIGEKRNKDFKIIAEIEMVFEI